MIEDDRWFIDAEACRAFVQTVEFAGRKWNAAILLALARGAERYTEVRALVAGISDPLLSARLRELEAQALVTRTVVPTTPVQIRYALTDSGRELLSSLHALNSWRQRRERSVPAPVGASESGAPRAR